MANAFFSAADGDLEYIFVTDYNDIDQYAATGSLWKWGGDGSGQLGDNTVVNKSSPVQTVAGGTNWKQVASTGYYHVAAIKTDGTLWLWGMNVFGALGDNTTVSKSSPIQTVAVVQIGNRLHVVDTTQQQLKLTELFGCGVIILMAN